MKVEVNFAALRRTKWHEYLIRFAFGGAVTALTGIIAKHWGPAVGGLFLAFPAIFPATGTLVEKHQKKKKMRSGWTKIERAREIAGVDAAGTSMGTLGLAAFAVIVWLWMPEHSAALVLAVATLAFVVVAVLAWLARKTMWRRLRIKFLSHRAHTEGIAIPQSSSTERKSHE